MDEIIEIFKKLPIYLNLFEKYDIMFIFIGGSRLVSDKLITEMSDYDIGVVIKGMKTIPEYDDERKIRYKIKGKSLHLFIINESFYASKNNTYETNTLLIKLYFFKLKNIIYVNQTYVNYPINLIKENKNFLKLGIIKFHSEYGKKFLSLLNKNRIYKQFYAYLLAYWILMGIKIDWDFLYDFKTDFSSARLKSDINFKHKVTSYLNTAYNYFNSYQLDTGLLIKQIAKGLKNYD